MDATAATAAVASPASRPPWELANSDSDSGSDSGSGSGSGYSEPVRTPFSEDTASFRGGTHLEARRADLFAEIPLAGEPGPFEPVSTESGGTLVTGVAAEIPGSSIPAAQSHWSAWGKAPDTPGQAAAAARRAGSLDDTTEEFPIMPGESAPGTSASPWPG